MSTGHSVEFISPLGEDLLLRRMTSREMLGRPFEIDLELLSPKADVAYDDLLGAQVSVRLALPNDADRFWNGIVSEFSQSGSVGRYYAYRARLRPWLSMLDLRRNCRIFQEKTVPEIVKELFREHGFTDFEENLAGSYPQRGYCVQYRESDFAFVSRLMESEGIYYFFKHEDGRHTLHLVDDARGHEPFEGYERVSLRLPTKEGREQERIMSWTARRALRSGKHALTSYDFTKPRADLGVSTSCEREHPHAEYEVFDYPGGHVETSRGETLARLRSERAQAGYERFEGDADARGLCCGHVFNLPNAPRPDQEGDYLLVAVESEINDESYESAREDAEAVQYGCRFEAMSVQVPFRPEPLTPSPLIRGPQTALVVGKQGEEIWTDEHGRVKVQFHWDRYGEQDENSSCWVRVSSAWAGQQWGAIQIPRIGQEVIVEFLEGSPDCPIITGRVYNGANKPPYGLPANATQSGVKSRSSKGGGAGDFNEIRFEDKKGEEQVYIHAEKDHKQVTENCRTESVGVNRSLSVGKNLDETIGEKKTINVGTDHDETIGASKTLMVGSNHTETIGADMTITVGSNLSETIGSNYGEIVGSSMTLTIGSVYGLTVGAAMNAAIGGGLALEVGALKSENVGGNSSEDVGGSKQVTAGSNLTLEAGSNADVKAGGDGSVEIGGDLSVKASKVVIDAKDQIVLKAGGASIELTKSGDVNIKGKKVNVKSSGPVILKGSKIQEN